MRTRGHRACISGLYRTRRRRLRARLERDKRETTTRAAFDPPPPPAQANQQRLDEAKSLLQKTMPVARRVLGADNRLTLQMRTNYALALYEDDGATLDDLREAVTTLEETARTARRVLGSSHPLTPTIERYLQKARTALRARKVLQTSDELAAQLEI